jgi:serine O-acetyltransferase
VSARLQVTLRRLSAVGDQRAERGRSAADTSIGDHGPGLFELLREDWRAHSPRPLAKPGFHAMALHRFGYWQQRLSPGLRLPARIVHDAFYYITRVLYGIELPRNTTVGRRVVIAHQGGVVIGWGAEIGDDCLIRQNVTIGATETGGPDPRIGSRVDIGAGAVIMGGITVGDDVLIGPNAVVSSDIPAGSRVVAPPARILGPRGTQNSPPQPSNARGATDDDVIGVIANALDLGESLSRDTPLLSSGLVDSLNLVVLLEALEHVYDVDIPSDAITVDVFDTPEQIAAFVAECRR